MDIIYFHSKLTKEINICSKIYQLTFSHLLINNEDILLTGFIDINLSDFQTKKIEELCNNFKELYNDIVFNVDIENREFHFIQKKYYDFIKNNHIDKVIIEEKKINNSVYLKFIEDYIFNVLNLKINYYTFQIYEDSIIESMYICEKINYNHIELNNYFNDDLLSKNIHKFYEFSMLLKIDGFIFEKDKFIKYMSKDQL